MTEQKRNRIELELRRRGFPGGRIEHLLTHGAQELEGLSEDTSREELMRIVGAIEDRAKASVDDGE